MKKLSNLGRVLQREEQAKIMGGFGPTDYYVYCSNDNVHFTQVAAGPWSTSTACHTYLFSSVCGWSSECLFSKCTGDMASCA